MGGRGRFLAPQESTPVGLRRKGSPIWTDGIPFWPNGNLISAEGNPILAGVLRRSETAVLRTGRYGELMSFFCLYPSFLSYLRLLHTMSLLHAYLAGRARRPYVTICRCASAMFLSTDAESISANGLLKYASLSIAHDSLRTTRKQQQTSIAPTTKKAIAKPLTYAVVQSVL